jgi:hypothetical protein
VDIFTRQVMFLWLYIITTCDLICNLHAHPRHALAPYCLRICTLLFYFILFYFIFYFILFSKFSFMISVMLAELSFGLIS